MTPEELREGNRKRQIIFLERHREEVNAARRKRYEDRKDKNVCPRCGKKLRARYKKIMCAECLEYNRINQNEQRILAQEKKAAAKKTGVKKAASKSTPKKAASDAKKATTKTTKSVKKTTTKTTVKPAKKKSGLQKQKPPKKTS